MRALVPFALVLVAGCSSHIPCFGTICIDGGDGVADMAGGDFAGLRLPSGTYTVSNVTTVRKGCRSAPVPGALPLVYDGTTLSLGQRYEPNSSPAFSPAGYALGSGSLGSGTSALLSLVTTVTLSDGCSFTRSDSSAVTVLGGIMLTVDWTHRETGYSALCTTVDEAPTDPCVSEQKFDLSL
jgi:hypothetical protein